MLQAVIRNNQTRNTCRQSPARSIAVTREATEVYRSCCDRRTYNGVDARLTTESSQCCVVATELLPTAVVVPPKPTSVVLVGCVFEPPLARFSPRYPFHLLLVLQIRVLNNQTPKLILKGDPKPHQTGQYSMQPVRPLGREACMRTFTTITLFTRMSDPNSGKYRLQLIHDHLKHIVKRLHRVKRS